MVVAVVMAAVSASSLPAIPLCPGIHRRVVGPGYLRVLLAGIVDPVALSPVRGALPPV